MSCRLHKNHGSSIVLTEEDHKEVPCECMGGICYNGLCRYKSACKDSFLAPGLDGNWTSTKNEFITGSSDLASFVYHYHYHLEQRTGGAAPSRLTDPIWTC
eukprot:1243540-Amorphochlora_amoeboformis.AAC.1